MVRDAHNCCDSSCIGDIVCLVRDICCNFLWLLVVLYSSAWLRKCAAPVSSAAASSSDVGAAGREQCAADKSGPRHLRRHGSIENWRWIACLTLCLINCADYADVLLGDRHGARRCVYSRWATASGAVTAITSGCAYQAFLVSRYFLIKITHTITFLFNFYAVISFCLDKFKIMSAYLTATLSRAFNCESKVKIFNFNFFIILII